MAYQKVINDWCLNRTFMELKLIKFKLTSFIIDCLNRTFMELKCVKTMAASIVGLSQSYLYGIEIEGQCVDKADFI